LRTAHSTAKGRNVDTKSRAAPVEAANDGHSSISRDWRADRGGAAARHDMAQRGTAAPDSRRHLAAIPGPWAAAIHPHHVSVRSRGAVLRTAALAAAAQGAAPADRLAMA
jgi:hypothetical protein